MHVQCSREAYTRLARSGLYHGPIDLRTKNRRTGQSYAAKPQLYTGTLIHLHKKKKKKKKKNINLFVLH